ncbi:hypothetical protein VPDG_00065 [Vibrio phage henriette 12B8]|uniref:hypothetical protein n=1 Tax=Vibrio phage henriette 12B8 TaxID=573174 RepID=UPI0002C1424D|nr:hypothetical protein VPDG_00065 [Vibrio phage henriette 12B8]AGG58226.1 hypothetical protein VPDG_00065 [Vibrio phage henriette 12B8]
MPNGINQQEKEYFFRVTVVVAKNYPGLTNESHNHYNGTYTHTSDGYCSGKTAYNGFIEWATERYGQDGTMIVKAFNLI